LNQAASARSTAHGLYAAIVANLLFPLHERLKGHDTVQALRELEKSQWLSPVELRELQLRRLRGLLEHAARHVPYYRGLFGRLRFSASSVSSLRDLERIPFLTKDIVRTHLDDLKAEDAQDLRLFSTTGSSGDPLRFYIGKRRVSRDVAAKWRATRWLGVELGERELVFWSSPIEVSAQDSVRAWRDRLLRTRLRASANVSPARLDEFIAEILAFRPAMIFGYPSVIDLVCQRAEDRAIDLRVAGTRAIFATAERLYPQQRERMQRVFGCTVANGYGGRDAGFIAHECAAGGMHITSEDLIVEIVDENGRQLGPGEPGQVAVTHLFTAEFPFIRYLNGDVAVLSAATCGCGRGLPLLEDIRGRTNDFIVAADGRLVHDVAFAVLLRDMPGVKMFKIIQHEINRLELLLVTTADFDSRGAPDRIRALFVQRLDPAIELTIRHVDDIPPEPTGKYRYVISKVPRPSGRYT